MSMRTMDKWAAQAEAEYDAHTRPYKVERRDGAWHVFNGKCQVAGPYPTEEQAIKVRDEMEKEQPMREYNYPVYATQGGGLARFVGDVAIFVEKPDCPGFDVGDVVPKDWSMIPANDRARHEMAMADDEATA